MFGADFQFKKNISFRSRLGYRFLGEWYVGARVRSMHVFRQLDQVSGVSDNVRILDAGCGGGAYCFYLARKYPASHIIGMELSEVFMQEAKHITMRTGLTNVQFLKGDLISKSIPKMI